MNNGIFIYTMVHDGWFFSKLIIIIFKFVTALQFAYYKSTNNENKISKLETDSDFKIINNLFINPSGLSYGAVTYGILLNYPSAGIFGWHVNDKQSN